MMTVALVQAVLLVSAFFAGVLFVVYRQNRSRAIRDYLGWHAGMTIFGALVGLGPWLSESRVLPPFAKTVVLGLLSLFLGWVTIRLSYVLTRRPFPRRLVWVNAAPVLAVAAVVVMAPSELGCIRVINAWLVLTSAATLGFLLLRIKLLDARIRRLMRAMLIVFAVCLPLFVVEITGIWPVSGSAFFFFLIWNMVGLVFVVKTGITSAPLTSVRSVPPNVAARYRLTAREVEITNLVIAGKSSQDIADQLFRSYKTVKNHLSNVYAKLGVSNRLELLALISEHSLD